MWARGARSVGRSLGLRVEGTASPPGGVRSFFPCGSFPAWCWDVLVTRVLVSPSYQAESCKKKIKSQGRNQSQYHGVKWHCGEARLSGQAGMVRPALGAGRRWTVLNLGGGREPPQRVGRAETPEGTSCQQHLLSQGPLVAQGAKARDRHMSVPMSPRQAGLRL